jgi:hypothetical protein
MLVLFSRICDGLHNLFCQLHEPDVICLMYVELRQVDVLVLRLLMMHSTYFV